MNQTFFNWINVFAFAFTLITLLMTLNIRGKIDRSLGKQRFLQQRERIVADFTAVRNKLKLAGEDEQARDVCLLDLRALSLQLDHFRIWRWNDRLKLKQFIRFMSKAYMPESPKAKITGKELIMRVDEIVAIIKSQPEV